MSGAMNQYLDLSQLTLHPDFSRAAREAAVARLLHGEPLADNGVDRHCRRLDSLFRRFVTTCPVAEWAPGLLLTAEIRRQYELYLPLSAITPALTAVCRRSCRYEPPATLTAMATALSWPDALAALMPLPLPANPAALLRRFAADVPWRHAVLAALSVPARFGGSFGRYPRQVAFLHRWLAGNAPRLGRRAAILDAACGTGEGTYVVAATLSALGFGEHSQVDGSSLEPLELVAAAHGWFPQDEARGEAFISEAKRLSAGGADGMIRFRQEDLCRPWERRETYDVILCNGLLGGPLLFERQAIAGVVALLTARLRPGGLLLAANRFHGGWQRTTPSATLAELLTERGLRVERAGEGLAAVRSG